MLARMFRPHPFVLSRMSAMRPAAVRPAVVRMVSTDLGAPLRSREEQEATTPRRGMATAVTTTSAQKDTALETGYQYLSLYRGPVGDKSQRTVHYAITGSTRFVYAAAVRVFILKLLYTWTAAADVMAMSTVEFNTSALGPGEATTIKWRGKPVFIRHLTADEVVGVNGEDVGALRDPETHAARVQKEDWSITLGVCTHLGCVPIHMAGDWGGYFCPCHGSHYDASGRIMKGPAPENLEVPEYKFLDEDTILIG